MMAYTRRVKEAAIRMMLPPESKPLTKIITERKTTTLTSAKINSQ